MRITSKGQVTIPQAIRERAGLMPNTEVEFIIDGDLVMLVKASEARRPTRGELIVRHLQAHPGRSSDDHRGAHGPHARRRVTASPRRHATCSSTSSRPTPSGLRGRPGGRRGGRGGRAGHQSRSSTARSPPGIRPSRSSTRPWNRVPSDARTSRTPQPSSRVAATWTIAGVGARGDLRCWTSTSAPTLRSPATACSRGTRRATARTSRRSNS